MSTGTVVDLLFAASGAIAIIGSLIAALRWLHHLAADIRQVREDWAGEPARPGVPGRQGVMERLSAQDTHLVNQDAHLERQDEQIAAIMRALGLPDHQEPDGGVSE